MAITIPTTLIIVVRSTMPMIPITITMTFGIPLTNQ